jgi:hypothetical protein
MIVYASGSVAKVYHSHIYSIKADSPGEKLLFRYVRLS